MARRKIAAPAVNRALPLSLAAALIATLAMPAGAATPEDLRKDIFKGHLTEIGCKTISKGPKSRLEGLDQDLAKIVSTFVKGVKDNEPSVFKALFHKKTKVKSNIGERLLAPLRGRYRRPWDVTVFRIFALNTVNGDKTSIHCAEDGVSVKSIFGYDLQFGAWIQVMGQNDLVRLYITIAPTEGTWKIVGLHVQQWTFDGLDHERWIKKGLAEVGKNKVLAHMNFDIAQKLLFGGSFLSFDIKQKVIEELDLNLPKDDWIKLANKKLADGNLVYLGTLLTPEGLGIVLRYKVQKYLTMPEVQTRCRKSGLALYKLGWLTKGKGGVRCEYLLPRENPDKEGIMGSQYFTYKDLTL